MYSDNDAAAAGVSFSLSGGWLSGGWSRRDMANGDVGDEPSAFALSIGYSNVKPADALERKHSMMTVMQWQLTAGKELT
jgi:hypothetical protein